MRATQYERCCRVSITSHAELKCVPPSKATQEVKKEHAAKRTERAKERRKEREIVFVCFFFGCQVCCSGVLIDMHISNVDCTRTCCTAADEPATRTRTCAQCAWWARDDDDVIATTPPGYVGMKHVSHPSENNNNNIINNMHQARTQNSVGETHNTQQTRRCCCCCCCHRCDATVIQQHPSRCAPTGYHGRDRVCVLLVHRCTAARLHTR